MVCGSVVESIFTKDRGEQPISPLCYDWRHRKITGSQDFPYNLIFLVRVRRQLAAVGENVSQEDVEKMLSEKGQDLVALLNGKKRKLIQIFFRQVNPLSVTGKAAIDDAKQRHGEIMKLEESILELHDCYIDMQNLVAMQVSE